MTTIQTLEATAAEARAAQLAAYQELDAAKRAAAVRAELRWHTERGKYGRTQHVLDRIYIAADGGWASTDRCLAVVWSTGKVYVEAYGRDQAYGINWAPRISGTPRDRVTYARTLGRAKVAADSYHR